MFRVCFQTIGISTPKSASLVKTISFMILVKRNAFDALKLLQFYLKTDSNVLPVLKALFSEKIKTPVWILLLFANQIMFSILEKINVNVQMRLLLTMERNAKLVCFLITGVWRRKSVYLAHRTSFMILLLRNV